MALFRPVRAFVEAYAKHSILNIGQVLHGLRHIHSDPDVDAVATPGSVEHLTMSVALRSTRLANDAFFATIPPHWHHSSAEVESLRKGSLATWFGCGYAAWRYNEDGTRKVELGEHVDKRWDPRCK